MKNKELMEYLQNFDGDKEFGLLVVNLEKDTRLRASGYELVKDGEIDFPLMVVEVDDEIPLEECRNGKEPTVRRSMAQTLEEIREVIHAEPAHGNYLHDEHQRYVKIARIMAECEE